jgi:hypothetical protein
MSDVNPIEYRSLEPLGFPGYRVGSDGTVWTCWHKKGRGWRYGFETVKGEWRQLKARPTPAGYLIVCLFPGARWRQVQRLVLETFVGPCPPGKQCCHGPDFTKTNCALSNLRWDTPVANIAERDQNGHVFQGEKHRDAKVTAEQVREIRAAYAKKQKLRGYTPRGFTRAMASKYGLSTGQIRSIVTRKSWKHVSDLAV